MSNYISDISRLRGIDRLGEDSKVKTQKQPGTSLDMTDFLQLIVAQFQNQDPENTASTSDMLNQLVQMSVIQAITNITDATTLMYSASLVGKEVTVGEFDRQGKLQEIVGTVTATGTYNGESVIFVDGVSYPLSSIMAVGRLPEKPDDENKGEDNQKPEDTPPAPET